MIDIKLIRESPKQVQKKIKERGYDVDIALLIKLDKEWRENKEETDKIRARRNTISREISELKKSGKDAGKQMQEARKIPQQLEETEAKLKKLEEQIHAILQIIPNIQHDSVPIGNAEKNKEIKKGGKINSFSFPVKSHDVLLKNLGLLDMEAGAKLSGSGFYVLKGEVAQLQRALIQYMLNFHLKNGFIEINPPQLVNAQAMFGTGNLPKFEQNLYKTQENLYLIPTAEVSLTNLHAGEVLNENELPKKYVAFTQCYRTEAGRHGSETPGIFRVHQFEKVEMVYLCKPEDSWKLLDEMADHAEKLLIQLKIPYRKLILATADASFASAKTYDFEVWSPHLKKYLETSSCSNCTDFQARRMNAKYVKHETNERKFIHTLNGSGLALPRLLISLIENYQSKDGSIKIPRILQEYMNGKKKIAVKNSILKK